MSKDAARTCARDSILDAAGCLIGLYGYNKTTVDDIAHEAGIGKGTVYLHFHSKEEIALSWIGRINDQLQEELSRIAGSAGSVIERLKEMLITRVMLRLDSARDHTKGIDELLFALRPSLLECRERWFRTEAALFAKVLAEGNSSSAICVDDPRASAYSLLHATNSFLPYSLSAKQIGERKEVARAVARVADLLIFGLVTRNSSKQEAH